MVPWRKLAIRYLFVVAALVFPGVGNVRAQVSVVTANYDNARTNANLNEQVLNPSNVNTGQFGLLFSLTVDGEIYAQPLYVSGLVMPGGGVVNVVYTATMHNSVYAFDADAGSLIWQVNLGASVPSSYYGSKFGVSDITPEVGILSTPVIDPVAQVIYVVANTYENGEYLYRLHALDLATGIEEMNGPAVIQASVEGGGVDSVGGSVAFNPSEQLQRPGLLLSGGVIYVAFASHGDEDPFHGWIIAYDSSDLSQQIGAFNTTPNGAEGGIWQCGRGLATDDSGNIFTVVGNGDFDGSENFGESFLRLATASGLAVADSFTPDNWQGLDEGDQDLGTAGPVLVPNTNLILGGSKGGELYVLDSTNMGGIQDGNTQAIQIFQALGGFLFNMALWATASGATVYVQGESDGVKAYCLSGGTFDTTPCSSNPTVAATAKGGIALSANGSMPGTAILWTTTTSAVNAPLAPGTLHAFDASNVSNELWNSNLTGGPDVLSSFAKFANPTIANGKVYVPTFSNQLVVYGLRGPSIESSRLVKRVPSR